MGGYGSGQWVRIGTKRSTSSAIALDICALTEHGLLRCSTSTFASSTWTDSRTGETIGTIEHIIHAERDRGVIELRYWSSDFGESTKLIFARKARSHTSAGFAGGSAVRSRGNDLVCCTRSVGSDTSPAGMRSVLRTTAATMTPNRALFGRLARFGPAWGRTLRTDIAFNRSRRGCTGRHFYVRWSELIGLRSEPIEFGPARLL